MLSDFLAACQLTLSSVGKKVELQLGTEKQCVLDCATGEHASELIEKLHWDNFKTALHH